MSYSNDEPEPMSEAARKRVQREREFEASNRFIAEEYERRRTDRLDGVFGEAVAHVAARGDEWPRVLEGVLRDLAPQAGNLPGRRRDLTEVHLVMVADQTITSRYIPCSDGSALIEICTGLVSLATSLARYLADILDRIMSATSLRDLLGRAGRVARGELLSEADLAVTTCLVRYHLIHRLAFRNSAALHYTLRPAVESLTDVLVNDILRFTVAHELAHHLLGHVPREAGHTMLTCGNDHDREFAADRAGLHLMCRQTRDVRVATIGALLAMTAVEIAERALYARPGVTHPPASDRFTALRALLPRIARHGTDALLAGVTLVTDRATDLSRELGLTWWRTMYLSPRVVTDPHPESYFELMWKLDSELCSPLAHAHDVIAHIDRSFGTSAQEALTITASGGDLRAALRTFGVTGRDLKVLCRPRHSLLLGTLWHTIDETYRTSTPLNRTQRLIVSMAASRLIAPHTRRTT